MPVRGLQLTAKQQPEGERHESTSAQSLSALMSSHITVLCFSPHPTPAIPLIYVLLILAYCHLEIISTVRFGLPTPDSCFLPAAVDGGYTDWSDWGECSATCGGGVRGRSRTCTSPPPAQGGKNCEELGPASEEEACNEDPCGELLTEHEIRDIDLMQRRTPQN